jgi:hypothetical protein
MTLKARLAKLEAKRKRILRCHWCQYSLRTVRPGELNTDSNGTENLLAAKCWACGTGFGVSLAGQDKYEREVTSIVYNSHPAAKFTEERVHVAFIYYFLLPEIRKHVSKKGGKVESTVSNPRYASPPVKTVTSPPSLAEEKRKKEREELKRKAIEFRRITNERMKSLAGGPDSFPIDQTISEIQDECVIWRYTIGFTETLGLDMNHQSRFDLEKTIEPLVNFLRALKTQAACAEVLWGESLGVTLNEIKSVERQIHEEFDKAVREAREKVALEEKQLAEAAERDRQEKEEARRMQLAQFEAGAEDRRERCGNVDSKDSGNVPVSNLSEEDQMKRIARVMESLRAKPQPSSQTPEFQFYGRPRPIGPTIQPQRFSGPVRERYRRPNK